MNNAWEDGSDHDEGIYVSYIEKVAVGPATDLATKAHEVNGDGTRVRGRRRVPKERTGSPRRVQV